MKRERKNLNDIVECRVLFNLMIVPPNHPFEFVCSNCNFRSKCEGFACYGDETKSSIMLKTPCYYVLSDEPYYEKMPIILGYHCSECNEPVCMGEECSIFYDKPYCLKCVKKNINVVPLEELEKSIKSRSHQNS